MKNRPSWWQTKLTVWIPDQAVVDFYSLGLGEIYPIAASHGRGVLSLLEHVLLPWMEDLAPQEEVDEDR
ncbi:GTP-binding protein EngA [Escherichia coli]|uniref:GTP-binding protein EngA n=1 Tax=Escherichia coli TaxID=562 RepID=A0A376REW9_ECOLX|nr:GTP-binding protein EngA [Escherichia coli]